MDTWAAIDTQMKPYAPILRDDLKIDISCSNNLATVIANEIQNLLETSPQKVPVDENILITDRFSELCAFQGFMNALNDNPKTTNPAFIRAQVITQNYISFVYLGDACFKFLCKNSRSNSTTKKCCKFLTNNPVRAFRNAFAHANWKYKYDYSGLIFWARKGSDPKDPMTQFEVSQKNLNFWQSLSRCVAYVYYQTVLEFQQNEK